MTKDEREYQINVALSHIRVLLKKRGDDPNSYSYKFLREKAEQVVDEWLKDNPGQMPYVRLGEK